MYGKLVKRLRNEADCPDNYPEDSNLMREAADAIEELSKRVRPVVRGKWVQDCDYHFRCSVCGDRYVVSNGNPLDIANGWNFCPNCGADMREPPKEE